MSGTCARTVTEMTWFTVSSGQPRELQRSLAPRVSLVAPVPVRFARQMGAELVIAVDISSPPDGNPTGDPFKMLLQTFSIMGKSINSLELKDADIVIRPPLAGVSSADFSARKRAIDAGREAAMAALVALRQRVLALTH